MAPPTPPQPHETHYGDDYEDDDDEPDEWERALNECGQTDNAGCLMAGTEFCDFDCPFRDTDLFAEDE